MTLSELLATEPYASMTDAAAAAAINAATVDVVGEVPSTELLAWAAGGGRLARMEAAASGQFSAATTAAIAAEPALTSDGVRSMARAAVLLIERDGTVLDMSKADRVALVDALALAEVLTGAEKASLVALATRAVPLATTLDGCPVPVLPGDVLAARA